MQTPDESDGGLASAEKICSYIIDAYNRGVIEQLFMESVCELNAREIAKRRKELLRCVHPDKHIVYEVCNRYLCCSLILSTGNAEKIQFRHEYCQ